MTPRSNDSKKHPSLSADDANPPLRRRPFHPLMVNYEANGTRHALRVMTVMRLLAEAAFTCSRTDRFASCITTSSSKSPTWSRDPNQGAKN